MASKDNSASHWDDIYGSRGDEALSWTQASPDLSLSLMTDLPPGFAAVDVGAGRSLLTGALLTRGAGHVTLLDLSAQALADARATLPADAPIELVAADIREWQPTRRYDLWHDRAAFHFLTDTAGQSVYMQVLDRSLAPGAVAIIAGFAPDGPEKCSGLPVARHDSGAIADMAGSGFVLQRSVRHLHHTPGGTAQPFLFTVLQKRN
jgi:trans-aconitate methyltransferase